MNKLYLTILFTLLPFVSVFAEEPAPRADFQTVLNRSIFPLQDQIRFYNRKIAFKEDSCFASKDSLGIFNLVESDGALNYECIGIYKDKSPTSDFEYGPYMGEVFTDIPCPGEIDVEYTKQENPSVIRQYCLDSQGQIVWERDAKDNYVPNTSKNIVFYRDGNSFTVYLNKKIVAQMIYSKDEILRMDKRNPKVFFHVKYVRDERNNVIREVHLNQDGYPYSIYEAEYEGGRCRRIYKIDGYTYKRTVYEFN